MSACPHPSRSLPVPVCVLMSALEERKTPRGLDGARLMQPDEDDEWSTPTKEEPPLSMAELVEYWISVWEASRLPQQCQ